MDDQVECSIDKLEMNDQDDRSSIIGELETDDEDDCSSSDDSSTDEQDDCSSIGDEMEMDWSYGKYQEDTLLDQIQKQQHEVSARVGHTGQEPARPTIGFSQAPIQPERLGVLGSYPHGLVIAPDGYTPNKRSHRGPDNEYLEFDPSRYQNYRSMVDQLEESKFYEAFNAGRPTLTVEDLTWDRVQREFTALHGRCNPYLDCTSTGPLAAQLADYKIFRIEQLNSWQENIKKYGQLIFLKDSYELEEMAPTPSRDLSKLIKRTFSPQELTSFELDPWKNLNGTDHYIIPREATSSSCLRLDDRSLKEEHENEDTREVSQSEAWAEQMQGLLLMFPLGIHTSRFGEKFLKDPPKTEEELETLDKMFNEMTDVFYRQFDSELDELTTNGSSYRQGIIFSAHFEGLVEEVMRLVSRVWKRYRSMVICEGKPLPLSEAGWEQFESYLAGRCPDKKRRWYHVFHYTDWNFQSHEAIVRFCFNKWRNDNFYILLPGTVVKVKGQSHKLTETSIYYGRRESFIFPEDIPVFEPRPLPVISEIPVGTSLMGSKIHRLTDEIKVGQVHLYSGGSYKYPYLFGVIDPIHFYCYEKNLKPRMQEVYDLYKDPESKSNFRVVPANLTFGNVVAVPYKNEWNRATIIKAIGSDKYMVYLIDWGSFIFISYKFMRYLKTEFMHFPAVGILCRLIVPKEVEHNDYEGCRRWDEIISEKFISCMQNKMVCLKFVCSTKFQGQLVWEVHASQAHVTRGYKIPHATIPDISLWVYQGSMLGYLKRLQKNDGGVLDVQKQAQRKIFYCEKHFDDEGDEVVEEVYFSGSAVYQEQIPVYIIEEKPTAVYQKPEPEKEDDVANLADFSEEDLTEEPKEDMDAEVLQPFDIDEVSLTLPKPRIVLDELNDYANLADFIGENSNEEPEADLDAEVLQPLDVERFSSVLPEPRRIFEEQLEVN